MGSIEKLLTSITNNKLAYSLPEVASATTLSQSLLRNGRAEGDEDWTPDGDPSGRFGKLSPRSEVRLT